MRIPVRILLTLTLGLCTHALDASGTSFKRPSGGPEQGYFGKAMAIQGATLVVGAPGFDPSGPDGAAGGGNAYVRSRGSNGTTVLLAELRPNDVALGDEYGSAVAIRGDLIAVGSPGAEPDDTGRVLLWRMGSNTSDWTLEDEILSPTLLPGISFGADVCLTEINGVPRLAIGSRSSRVFIYRLDMAGWALEKTYIQFGIGESIRMDGTTLAAGAPEALGEGRVWVYTFNGSAWPASGVRVEDPTPSADGLFGASVDLVGSTLVVGSPNWSDGTNNLGAVLFFKRVPGSWTFEDRVEGYVGEEFGSAVDLDSTGTRAAALGAQGTRALYFSDVGGGWAFSPDLQPGNLTAGDLAGGSIVVALDGNNPVVLAGAPHHDGLGGLDTGIAFDFEGSGGSWNEGVSQSPVNHTLEDQVGGAVDVEGVTYVVGSRNDDEGASDAGAAYVYREIQSPDGGTFASQISKLTADLDAGIDAEFGEALAIDGGRIAVGAPSEAVGGNLPTGAVYVFAEDSSGWYREARLEPSDLVVGSRFGDSVSLTRHLVAVGATGGTDPNGVLTGAVYLYREAGSNWTLEAKLAPPGGSGAAFGLFGTSVSADETRVAVGAPLRKVGTHFEAGEVFVYVKANGSWALEDSFAAPNTQTFGNFGLAVSLQGNRLAIGEPENNFAGGIGRVHLYVRTTSGWQYSDVATPSNGQAGDAFGSSLDLDGEALFVGAPNSGGVSLGESFGSSYLFQLSSQGVGEVCIESQSASKLSGASVAYDDGRATVGAPFSDGTTSATGAAAVNVGLFEEQDSPDVSGPEVYCFAAADSAGCIPWIDYTGEPSISAQTPFVLTAQDCFNNKSALLMYSLSGQTELPWFGKTLCIKPPIGRTTIQFTGGTAGPPDCSGSLAWDIHAWMATGNDPNLAAGVRFNGQFRYRDPQASGGLNVTNAIEVNFLP